MIDMLTPSSPWVSAAIAFAFIGGTWIACSIMRFTDDDETPFPRVVRFRKRRQTKGPLQQSLQEGTESLEKEVVSDSVA